MRKVIDRQTSPLDIKDKDGNIVETRTVRGKEAVAQAIIQIAMDRKNNANVRLTAFNTALDRAYGKPIQEIDMAATTTIQNDRTARIKDDLDRLSPEERDMYFELCEKVNAGNEAEQSGES